MQHTVCYIIFGLVSMVYRLRYSIWIPYRLYGIDLENFIRVRCSYFSSYSNIYPKIFHLRNLLTLSQIRSITREMKEVAAITGGSQGLGLACVERLVKDGYEVSVWTRTIRETPIKWK